MLKNQISFCFCIVFFLTIFKNSSCGLIKEFLGGGNKGGSLIPGFNFGFGVSIGAGNNKPQQPGNGPNFVGPNHHGPPHGHPHGGPPGLMHHHHSHGHPNYEEFERPNDNYNHDRYQHEGPPGHHHPQSHPNYEEFEQNRPNYDNNNQNRPNYDNNNQNRPNYGNDNQNRPNNENNHQNQPNYGNNNQNRPNYDNNQNQPHENNNENRPNYDDKNQNHPKPIYDKPGLPNDGNGPNYNNNQNGNIDPNQDGIIHITPKNPSVTTPRSIRSTTPKLDYDLDVRLGNENNGVVIDPSKFNPSTEKSLENEKIIFMDEKRKKRQTFDYFDSQLFSDNSEEEFELPVRKFRYYKCDLNEKCLPIDNCPQKTRVGKNKFCRNLVPSVCCNKTPIRKTRRPSISRDLGNSFQECGVVYENKRNSRNMAVPLPLAVGANPVQSLTNTPWMVAIGEVKENGDVSFMCGGSLLSDTVVLTAAHCLDGDPNFVRLGELDFATSEEKSSPTNIKINTFIQHPRYRQGVVYNDIGLIFLEKPVTFNKYIRPICLPSVTDNDYTEEILYLTGWGPEQKGGSPSSVLKYATVEIFNNTYCNELFKSANINMKNLPKGIISTQICAGDKNGGKDACEGDSGGPLGIIRGDIRIIIGIISSGIGCGYKNYPGVYTRVYSFVPWIQQYL